MRTNAHLFFLFRCLVFLAIIALPQAALPANTYRIEARIEPAISEIAGRLRLDYTNDSPATLTAVPLQFRGPFNVSGSDGKPLAIRPAEGEKPPEVLLDRPLPPGGRIQFNISFESHFRRQDGYAIAQVWHPRAVVYRDGKFNPLERQADSYDVTIIIPQAEVVAASGKLVDEQVLAGGTKRLSYRADNITQFGLVFSPDFRRTTRHAGGVEIRSLYFADGERWGKRLADYAARIVPFYRELFGFYPHEVLWIVPGSKTSGGGYPIASGIVAVHRTLDRSGENFAEWITAHEIGHQYWGYDTVVDSSTYYHWPGLPLGIWADRMYCEKHNPACLSQHRGFVNTYLSGVESDYDTTIRRTVAELSKLPFDTNNIVAHGKAYAVVQMLEAVIGREKFMALVRLLLDRYRWKYLSFDDFQAAAEEASGQKLGWFFDDWVNGNAVLRYAIDKVEHDGKQVRVTVRRTGTAALPVDLELLLADGSRQRKNIAREPQLQTVEFEATAAPLRAWLNPDRVFALHAREAEHVWGQKVELIAVEWPRPAAWGTNVTRVTVRNPDTRPHDVLLNLYSRSSATGRGVGWDTTHTLPAGATRTFERDMVLHPWPGTMHMRATLYDKTEEMRLARRETTAEFPVVNANMNALRLPEFLRPKSGRGEFPRLVPVEQPHFVLYYPEGSEYIASRVRDFAQQREQAYTELVPKLNPAFNKRIAVYLFPDTETKTAYTGHQGDGWAVGTIIAEVLNDKTAVDPNHELVHILTQELGNPPALFREGLAAYLQRGHLWKGHHVDAWARAFLEAGLLMPLRQIGALPEIGPDGTRPAIAYPQAGSFIKFLAEKYGFEKMMTAYQQLKFEAADEQRFIRIFGASPEAVEKEWREYLTAAPVEAVPATRIEEIRAKLK